MYECRVRGCFYGCLVGDALGAPVEFNERGTFPEVREMLPNKNFGRGLIPAGAFTDDGSMMMALAAAIVAAGGKQDPLTVLTHYKEWLFNGYLSSIDVCFDIGNTCRSAIFDFVRNDTLEANTSDKWQAGNGSLMRIAAVPIVWSKDPDEAWNQGEISSKTTHTNDEAVWACGIFSALVAHALNGKTKDELFEFLKMHTNEKITGDLIFKTREQIKSSGYVIDTLEATLWAFFTTDSFEDGLIKIVNLGDDADTVGAVFGTLAGAFYGVEAIPERWLSALQKRSMVDGVFADLWEMTKKKHGEE
jgi:ADP-ribosyl-[dinitrogen reductase] hydrolase